MTHIKLGSTVRDTHTGFVGMATERLERLHGSTRILIEAGYLDKDGKVPAPQWFDEPRIEVVDGDKPEAGFRP